MQLGISEILGRHWDLSTYRDELAARGWVHTFDLKRIVGIRILDELNTAIVSQALDLSYVAHGSTDADAVTLRFKTEEDALWARLIVT